MLEKLNDIIIYRGSTTSVEFNLSDFDFQGGFVRFTMRDKKNNLIKQEDMNTVGVNTVNFNDDFTATLTDSNYYYDLMWHVAGERIDQCAISDVKVIDTVGGAQYD